VVWIAGCFWRGIGNRDEDGWTGGDIEVYTSIYKILLKVFLQIDKFDYKSKTLRHYSVPAIRP
jgi:hypothetical protein